MSDRLTPRRATAICLFPLALLFLLFLAGPALGQVMSGATYTLGFDAEGGAGGESSGATYAHFAASGQTMSTVPATGATYGEKSGFVQVAEQANIGATGGGDGGGDVGGGEEGAGGGGGGCLIAAVAQGSYLEPRLDALRDFRDHYLLTNAPGQVFAAWYYRLSAPAAEAVRRHETLRSAARWALTPLVLAIAYPAPALLLFGGLILAVAARRRRR